MVCCFTSAQEYLTHLETSPLTMRGCKIRSTCMYAQYSHSAGGERGVITSILKLAVTRGLGLNRLRGRITQFSRFLRQAFRGTENLFQPKSHKSQAVLPQIPGCITTIIISTLTFRTNYTNHSNSTCEYV